MFNKKIQFLLSKIFAFISQVNHKKKVLPIFYAYLYAHKTIEDCAGAEEAGVELTSKLDRISYWKSRINGKCHILHQLWLIKTLPQAIISNKTRHYKMAARAMMHSKNHMTQETEKTLKGLYKYYSYVQLNV